MQKTTAILKNEHGSIMIVAILFLAILTIIGIAASRTSTTEVQISTNALEHNIAFYAADAGIAAGRTMLNALKIRDAGAWNLILTETEFTYTNSQSVDAQVTTLNAVLDAEGGRSVGGATYTLVVEDNEDLDDAPGVDTDDTVWLTSTATFKGSDATIRSLVRGGDVAYAQEHYDASSTGEAATESAAVSDSEVW